MGRTNPPALNGNTNTKRRGNPPFLLLALCVIVGGGAVFWILNSSEPKLAEVGKADFIRVDKSDRLMVLQRDGVVIAEYKIGLGGQPIGHKQFEGDQKTPEGIYKIDYRNPKSRYHLSLHISYPNEADKAYAESQGKSPGGDIMIHGFAPAMTAAKSIYDFGDWTLGCIAVTNAEIEQIWNAVDDGTKIEIRP